MHHHLIFTTLVATMPSFSSSSVATPSSHSKPKPSSHSHLCNHSPSATLDLLILLLVLFAGAFLLSSYLSYIFNSLSLLFSQSQFPIPSPSYLIAFSLFSLFSLSAVKCCGSRSRKCERRGCRGLKKAMEFDLKMQTEESLRTGSGFGEIDKLPWKGGSEGNPDYECLRAELRKMAPPNGRAVLLFRSPCGCPIAKLEGWGSKKGKRHKRSSPKMTLNGGGGDHR
ncbi:unnamed protein product [Lupinus luteus]|uniref:Ribosomal protein L34e superfamily protein n=1 Tax=Lupinus luteus TaxID=3873 RepID=A0AAV1YMJ9_LUPLU